MSGTASPTHEQIEEHEPLGWVGNLGAAAIDLLIGARELYSVFVRTLYYTFRGRREKGALMALKSEQGQNAYFVPTATLEELMVAQGDRCFAYAPGTDTKYSNAGFTLLGYVLEHVTGRSFAAPNGSPAEHGNSLLAEFLSDELGFENGIEHSHTALGARDLAEPSYRSWSGCSGAGCNRSFSTRSFPSWRSRS